MEDSGAMGWRVGRKVAEEDRKRLEWASGVWIHEESLTLCCSIIQRFFDGDPGFFMACNCYVGSEDCGMQLPGAARMRPCNIIFLDQVEKAHASVCLVDHTFENRKRQSAMKQEEVRGVFRWELLITRVSELVLCNRFAAHEDQLRKVSRISMRSGPLVFSVSCFHYSSRLRIQRTLRI